MELKMVCSIDYSSNGVFASMWINDIKGNEYMTPFIKRCGSRSEAVRALSSLMKGRSEYYDCEKLEFKRVNHYKLGKDEIFEYRGFVREGEYDKERA